MSTTTMWCATFGGGRPQKRRKIKERPQHFPPRSMGEEAGGGQMMFGHGDVFLIRHGPRLDEESIASRTKWYMQAGKRGFDPPLTPDGKMVAREAAERFRQDVILKDNNFEVDRIFCSPLYRCLQTAEQFSVVLNLPVQLVAGLGECAAAIKESHSRGVRIADMPILSRGEILASCPDMRLLDESIPTDTFFEATRELCSRHSNAMFVTHREGIRDVYARTGIHIGRIPYCAIVPANYNADEDRWSVLEGGLPGRKIPPRRCK